MLAAKDLILELFAIIDADDYYGKGANHQMRNWRILDHTDTSIVIAGVILKNTLSDNGGVCRITEGHTHIDYVVETNNIVKIVNDNDEIEAEANSVALEPNSYWSE